MSVAREVEETLVRTWRDRWVDTTRWALANETFDPKEAEHVRVRVQSRPSGQETLGRPGKRKIDRRGALFLQIRVMPGQGNGRLSDLADIAGRVFECSRLAPHDIRLEAAQKGPAGEVEDGGRWWGLTVEVPFAYQDIV